MTSEMMREILFRGKTNDGKWVCGAYVAYNWYPTVEDADTEITGVVVEESNIIDYEDECLWVAVIPETVGQYTGLTDKNGKKIFEGDIVKHYYLDGNPDEYDIGRVFWNGATCMYLRTCKSGDSCPQIWDSCEYEVIGNIHDNPELLKGGGEG